MGRIPEHVIDEIARSTDIVRLVGQYVELNRKGNRFWGLCPFHKEDTPSFTVSPERLSYKCFGCNEGGTVFQFLMKMENVEFLDAVRVLAERAGIDLTPYRGGDPEARDRTALLRQAHEFAADYFGKMLNMPPGRKAKQYLLDRHLTAESIETWRLGFAPPGWHNLDEAAAQRGFGRDVLVESGLVSMKEETGSTYDRFRNRVMFPIADRSSRVIGFGGREFDTDEGPKYLNSPESNLFSKGRNLYGLAEAKEAIRGRGSIAVVEGYMDVIMAHQFRVNWVVGVLGTALTEFHAREIKRLCDTVVLVFDADAAGQKAASRSLEVLLREDVNIRVATLPGGMDPCDFVLAEGADAFIARLDSSVDFFQFRLQAARAKYPEGSISSHQQIFEELLPLALTSKDPARRDLLVRSIARDLGIAETTVWNQLQAANKSHRRETPQAQGAASEAKRARMPVWQKMLRDVFGMLLAEPVLVREAPVAEFVCKFPSCPEKRLFGDWLEYAGLGEEPAVSIFMSRLADPLLSTMLVDILEDEEAVADKTALSRTERLRNCLAHFNVKREKSERRGLKQKLSQVQDADAERELLRRFQKK